MKVLKAKVVVSFRLYEGLFEGLKDVAHVQFGPFSNMDEFLKELKDAEALIVGGLDQIDEETLKVASRLRVVARSGVGYEKIDVSACTRRGIYVTYTPGVLSAAVADLTMALILCLSRRILEADAYTRTGWAKGAPVPWGRDVEDKTLGIIGFGRIGREVARRARVFDMKIVYYDVVKPGSEESLETRFVELDELLETSDFVSIHVPLTSVTKGLIGRREIGLMKKEAYLINTSRGAVVDEEALYEALKEGLIAGAALDVYAREPLPLESPLINLKNVVLTPHIGTTTVETRRKMLQLAIENVKRVLQGGLPLTPVPEQEGKTFLKSL